MNWKENIHKHNQNLDVLVSGVIPPNPYQLLESKNFNKLIQDAKKSYDLIIIDTSPCLLVSDTFLIAQLASLIKGQEIILTKN